MSGTFASGSCERFAETVSFRCAQLGLSALSSAVLTHVASFGEVCFQTYARIAEALSLNGRKPHPESVGRIVRQLSDAGLLGHRRILPGETPERAKWRSAQGTTENRIMVGALGVKRLPKRERSALRARAAQVLAPAAVLAASFLIGAIRVRALE